MPKNAVLIMLVTFFCSLPAGATERISVEFKLTKGDKMINKGSDIISGKPHSWSRGMKRSYLRVRCNDQNSGKARKTYSTEDHFSGLKILFNPVSDGIQITVTHSNVVPRLKEIRKLKTSECENLAPIVNATTSEYHVSKSIHQRQVFEFGQGMKFSVALVQL